MDDFLLSFFYPMMLVLAEILVVSDFMSCHQIAHIS